MVSFVNPRSRHPFHMHDMVRAQPRFVAETLRRLESADVETFLEEPSYLVVTGCGTSFHAAMYGAEVLQKSWDGRAVVHAVHAYDLLQEGLPAGADAILGISHSGNTSTTNQALALSRRSGARTLGLCGIPGSPMEGFAEEILLIGSTHDHSWANTMSYTTQLAALAYLAKNAGEGLGSVQDRHLTGLPRKITQALRTEASVRRLAKQVAKRARVTFLGSGLDAITALEAALKIRETCSLPASGYHTEQFLHGPFLSLDLKEAVVALLSRDDGRRARDILDGLGEIGVHVTTIGEGKGVDIPLPSMPRVLRPILSVVPLQFLAYYAALERKSNPDVMRSDRRRYRPALGSLFR
jgi:glucosamine--fructose-6-phosphate aminotransferase (isomerizing)